MVELKSVTDDADKRLFGSNLFEENTGRQGMNSARDKSFKQKSMPQSAKSLSQKKFNILTNQQVLVKI